MHPEEAEIRQETYARARREHTDEVRRQIKDRTARAVEMVRALGIEPEDVRAVAAAREAGLLQPDLFGD